MANKRDFYHTQYQTRTGQTSYVVDVPDGDCQVELDIRSNKDVCVQLHTDIDPKKPGLVYATGKAVFGRFNVAGLLAISLNCSKDAIVSYKVQHRLRKMSDPINDEIVSLPVPPPQIPLQDLVSRIVGERLQEATGEKDPQVDLEELIEDLPYDVDEEFGIGHMEVDEDFGAKWQERTKQPRNPPAKPKSDPAPKPESPRVRDDEGKPGNQIDARVAEIEKLLVALKANQS